MLESEANQHSIYNGLTEFLAEKQYLQDKASLKKQTGLTGVADVASPMPNQAQATPPNNAKPIMPRLPLNNNSGLLTPEQMANLEYTLLDFDGEWLEYLGNPAHNFKLMVHGEPGHGKTVLLLRFAKYLADNFGPVLYIASEEFGSPTLSEKVKAFNIYSSDLMFARSVKEAKNIADFDFVLIDSVNHAKLDVEAFKDLTKKHPEKSFIIICQHNKDGSFKGGKEWEHEVDIAAEVINRELDVYKNRFGVTTNI